MTLFRRRNGNGDNGAGPIALIEAPAEEVIEPEPDTPPEPEMIWRCGDCGSIGTGSESMERHLRTIRRARGRECDRSLMREYLLRSPASQSTEISASGIWIVVCLDEDTPEGEIDSGFYSRRPGKMTAVVVEAKSGLEAIQTRYKDRVESLNSDAKITQRDDLNGRYVAIDFFTGHRAEALVTSDWRANVEVAKGSHT